MRCRRGVLGMGLLIVLRHVVQRSGMVDLNARIGRLNERSRGRLRPSSRCAADPRTDPAARKYDRLTFDDALRMGLKVVDAAAFALCMENKLPMIVFGMEGEGNVARAIRGERIGTLVSN